MEMQKLKIIMVLSLLIFYSDSFGQVKEYSFQVIKSGTGDKSIIFIPGFASSGDVWDETKAMFENDYTCYTFTMAGFAGAPSQVNPSFEKWKKSIADYIKSNKISKPIVVGHSMGGGLALAIAADYPDLLDKIVVVDALPCLAALMNPDFKSVETLDCSKIIEQIESTTDQQFYQMQKISIQNLVADTTKYDLLVNWSLLSDKKTFSKMYCDFSNTDLRDRLKNIKCPSLVLLEPYFKNLTPIIKQQYKDLKSMRLEFATKGLHFIMYDDREWYFRQLYNFIKGEHNGV